MKTVRNIDVHVLHVFTDEQSNFGDVATVIFDEGRKIPDDVRREIAGNLQAVETAFINDAAAHHVSFVHPDGELDFAGVPAVGVAWLLEQQEGRPIPRLQSRGGEITVFREGDLTWVRASLKAMPPWKHVQVANADAVERISLSEVGTRGHEMVWAWINEAVDFIRARSFAADWGVPEAMSNGSGAMQLAAVLGRAFTVRHGSGSIIYARPAGDGFADVGGRVVEGSSFTTSS